VSSKLTVFNNFCQKWQAVKSESPAKSRFERSIAEDRETPKCLNGSNCQDPIVNTTALSTALSNDAGLAIASSFPDNFYFLLRG
jgi:hypothetical protein